MQFTTIVAAFFFEKRQVRPNLYELVRAAGITDVASFDNVDRGALGFHDSDREVVGGRWRAFGDTWAILDEVDGLLCLQLYASMNSFLDAEIAAKDRQGRDEDLLLPYIATFRDACLSLKPMAAFLDTRAHYGDERWENKQGNREWVLSQAHMVAVSNANGLADERYSMLYLGEPLARLWNSNPIRDDRDMIEVPSGRLVFARSGPARMA
jgi:hypothetical protein